MKFTQLNRVNYIQTVEELELYLHKEQIEWYLHSRTGEICLHSWTEWITSTL
jgi:hypothetical protein